MYDAPGIGLAAIQVGVPKRVVTLDLAKKDEPPQPQVFINPEITWRRRRRAIYEEGCLSIPEYYEEVERPARVKVRYLDLDGKPQEIEADGLLATCLQHEIDHLNGVLVHRPYLQAQARPRHQEIRQGGEATGGGEAVIRGATSRESAYAYGVTLDCASFRRLASERAIESEINSCRFASSSWARRISRCRRWPSWSARGHEIAAVYTRAPKPAGRRGMELQPTPVGARRGASALPVLTPATLKTPEAQDAFRAHDADVAVVVAYGLILPQADPRCACRSAASTSMLRCCRAGAARRRSTARSWRAMPRPASWSCGWKRGSTPARWLWPSGVPIGADMTAGELHDELARARRRSDAAGARRRWSAARSRFTPQPADGRHLRRRRSTRTRRASTGRKPGSAVHDHIRGLSPFPGAWFEARQGDARQGAAVDAGAGSGAPGTVLDDQLTVACGDGAVRLARIAARRQAGR